MTHFINGFIVNSAMQGTALNPTGIPLVDAALAVLAGGLVIFAILLYFGVWATFYLFMGYWVYAILMSLKSLADGYRHGPYHLTFAFWGPLVAAFAAGGLGMLSAALAYAGMSVDPVVGPIYAQIVTPFEEALMDERGLGIALWALAIVALIFLHYSNVIQRFDGGMRAGTSKS